jgi:uncharacterized protein YfkK (UPF0435 family)
MLGVLLPPLPARAQVPIISIINAAAKKIVTALDLAVQKLQLETMGLQNAEKDLENSMELTKLTDITSWVQKQKDLYAGYYQELWQIKNALSTYERVKEMIEKEASIASGYKQATALIHQDKHFSPSEVTAMTSILTGIFNQSVETVKDIELVINAFVTQMADADRLRIIDEAGGKIDKNYTDLQNFHQQNVLISLQRAHDENDITATKLLYGIE